MKKSKLLIVLGIIMCMLTCTVVADEFDGLYEEDYMEEDYMEEEQLRGDYYEDEQLRYEYVEESIEEETSSLSQFSDVSSGDYYFAPVIWAVEEGVTSGTSDTTFSPFDTCTRGQVVTFLWRASGRPTPKMTNNIFTDVADNSYYNTAVLWAYENNITSGTTATTFSPEDTCTSGQVITFVWRALGKPSADISLLSETEQAQYYAPAVAWATESNLLGYSTTSFAAANPSPRADIVTYLYYALK